MRSLRLLADDLTGALDTAAEFASPENPIPVFWHGSVPADLPARAALDTGTRERDPASAAAIVRALTPSLAGAGLAFKKLDSLMRGPTLHELAACFAAGPWTHAVLAPAFPYQGRVTRDGRQYARGIGGAWSPAGPHLAPALRALGVSAYAALPEEAVRPGIGIFDAETDADLEAIVARVHAAGPVLWCGTGGLARALAAPMASSDGLDRLPRPILGLFGSDQAATAVQLAACAPYWLALAEHADDHRAEVAGRLEASGLVLVSLELPPGLPRDDAARRIAQALHGLARCLPRPGTLIAAGGETLRGLCLALGATHLEVHGRIVPGLPRSTMRGGPWDGAVAVSKSGAFGPPTLLRDLVVPAIAERFS